MGEKLADRLFSYVQDPRVAAPLALGLLLLVLGLPAELFWPQMTGVVLAVGSVGASVGCASER